MRPGRIVAAVIGWMMGREAASGRAHLDRILADEPDLGVFGRVRRLVAAQYIHTAADGTRHVGWRTWLLLWLLPAGFALGATVSFVGEAWRQQAGQLVEAEVVQVYRWEGTGPFDRGQAQYTPVLRFTDATGQERLLTPAMRHPGWNFPIGSRLMVRHVPGDGHVTVPGTAGYGVAAVVGLIALAFAAIALPLHLRLRRWQRGGGAALARHDPRV